MPSIASAIPAPLTASPRTTGTSARDPRRVTREGAHVVARAHERRDELGADEAGRAGDENPHRHPS